MVSAAGLIRGAGGLKPGALFLSENATSTTLSFNRSYNVGDKADLSLDTEPRSLWDAGRVKPETSKKLMLPTFIMPQPNFKELSGIAFSL